MVMTIGEKLSEHYPCKQENGVYEFRYIVDNNGKKKSKLFRGRLDFEYMTAEDGSDYVSGVRLKKRNVGICRVINEAVVRNSKFDVQKEETYYVFRAMLVGIAVLQCKMLSPIHIYIGGNLRFEGGALVDEKSMKPFKRLKYPE